MTDPTMTLKGKVSWFGGPNDTGVSPSEGLAFIYEIDMAPHLFLNYQPSGTTGLARRLDPEKPYIACRWDYDVYPKPSLLNHMAMVRSPKTGQEYLAYPADWGPNENTGRVADISPGLMEALGITTDDEVEVIYPYLEQEEAMPYNRIVISSGHGKLVRGASGILDEVNEARLVVEQLADELRNRGITVETFHDNTSTSQNQNLNTIVNYHNSQDRDLDISVHFNAYVETENPMGTEVLYITQSALASQLSAAIASVGLINRGGKKRTDLFFLNNTDMPAVLLEICFVDSEADAEIYKDEFEDICDALANSLTGKEEVVQPPPTTTTPSTIDIQTSGSVTIFINGTQIPNSWSR